MIHFHCEDVSFILRNKKAIRNWLLSLVHEEGFQCGEINLIYTSDDYLLKVNQQYLDHDYFTDVITFDYSDDKIRSGDVFMSVDTLKANAKELKIKQIDEFCRVAAHGVLHLCGYKDKTKSDKAQMTEKEDYYLSLRAF